MDKYIFLDIDGVLNNDATTSLTTEGYIFVDDYLVERLAEIVKATNAKLILSSDWRMEWISDNDDDNGVDFIELKEKLAEYNLYLIDKTGPIRNFRHLEIEEYLADHPEIQNYIIIDDRTDAGIRNHFIKTNGHNGLSIRNMEQAIDMLKSGGV